MTYHRGLKAFVVAVIAGYMIAGAAYPAVAQYSGYAGPGDGMAPPMMGNAFGDSGGAAYSMPDSPAFPSYSDPPGDCMGNECYTPACPRGGWSAGASVYVLSPFTQNTALLATTATSATPSTLNWNYSASPAIWIGHRTAGGIKTRARFFYFDQISDPAVAGVTATSTISLALPTGIFPTPFVIGGAGTATMTVNNRLFFNIGDIESGVYEAAAGKYSFQVYAGARYAYMSSNTNAFGTAAAGGVTTQAIANFFHSFNGGGPTLFAQGYRQIGGSAFAWFGNARGALLVGSGHQQYNTTLTTARGAVVLTNTPFAFNNITTATLPMAEIETGLEYRIPCRNKMVFARVAAVDMTFFNFGGPFDTTSNLSLLGGRASIGCNY